MSKMSDEHAQELARIAAVEMNAALEELKHAGIEATVTVEEFEEQGSVRGCAVRVGIVRVLGVFMLVGCARQPTEPIATVVHTVRVFVNGQPRDVALDSPDHVIELSEILGACVTKDLVHAKLLRVGEQCPGAWLMVPGDAK